MSTLPKALSQSAPAGEEALRRGYSGGPAFKVGVGRVDAAIPHLNSYLVTLVGGGTVHAVAAGSGSTRRGGHRSLDTYVPGAGVIVLWPGHLTTAEVLIPPVIICSFPAWCLPPTGNDGTFAPGNILTDAPADYITNPAYALLVRQGLFTVLGQDRSYNAPLDLSPGDWGRMTSLGGGILVSEFYTRIAASPLCSLVLNYLNHTAELTARQLVMGTESYEKAVLARGPDSLMLEQLAWGAAEGLGAFGANPAMDDDGQNGLTCEFDQAGFFRRSVLAGGQVGGVWEVQKSALASGTDTRNGYGDKTVFPGMLSEYKGFDGTYRLQAAQSIRLEKTGLIMVPVQTDELTAAKWEKPADSTPVDLDVRMKASADERGRLMAIMNASLGQVLEREVWFEGLRKDGELWTFPTVAEIIETVGTVNHSHLPVLDEQAPEYTIEELNGITDHELDVGGGRKIKLFKNSSAFIMEADGGITIQDGFGAGITFNRGNVTITAPGDVRFLAGRDLQEFVPRNRTSVVGGRLEMTSVDGSVALSAAENLQLTSGTTGKGSTVLENKAEALPLTGITKDQVQKGEPLASGVHVVSASALTLAAVDSVYLGGVVQQGDSKTGMQTPICDILINAGEGSLAALGVIGNFLFKSSAAFGRSDAAAGLYVDQKRLFMLADSFTAATNTFALDKGEQEANLPRLGENGIEQVVVALPTAATDLVVHGGIVAGGDIQSRGTVRSKSPMQAPDFSKSNVNVSLPVSQSVQLKDLLTAKGNEVKLLLSHFTKGTGQATAWGLGALETAFPDSESLGASAYKVVAPGWFGMLLESTGWEIPEYHNHLFDLITRPFPGNQAYTETGGIVDWHADEGVTTKAWKEYRRNRKP